MPMIIGLFLWNKLPDEIPTHWNFSGDIDGYSSKGFAVFFPALFLLATHVLCIFVTMRDPKNEKLASVINQIVLWICPAVGVFLSAMIYPAAFEYPVDINFSMGVMMGIMFTVIGNYLPKCRPNHTIGIRVPWTLSNTQVWNKTHRMAGPLWMIGGIMILIGTFTGWHQGYVIVAVLVVLGIVPIAYSYLAYRKSER